MKAYLGIDTSNYTTSCALYFPQTDSFIQKKKLLPVKSGSIGIRQSDAVFHHTVQLPDLLDELFSQAGDVQLQAVGVSDAPRRQEGSYMPCFLAGLNSARSITSAGQINLYRFSHQQGHIAAAAHSCSKSDILNEAFIAFHISGGTTDALLVTPDAENVIDVKMCASSLDLKAGQAVDRVGVMLGYDFPAGRFVDSLALKSKNKYKISVKLKDGNCCLSGVENKCRKMFDSGELKEDISCYCLSYIGSAISAMADYQLELNGDKPILFSGGVMSSRFLKEKLSGKYNSYFAEPEFSCDNAAGVAYLAYLKDRL